MRFCAGHREGLSGQVTHDRDLNEGLEGAVQRREPDVQKP